MPVYDDAGVGYHDPTVENVENALLGVTAGLGRLEALPAHYQGIAVYCEWETDEREWRLLRSRFVGSLRK